MKYGGVWCAYTEDILALHDRGATAAQAVTLLRWFYVNNNLVWSLTPEVARYIAKVELGSNSRWHGQPKKLSLKTQHHRHRMAEIERERRERRRPLDMGGPRDEWMVWTPEMQAREFGLA